MESKELAYKALDELEANLGNWNQSQWDKCYASFVCRANGDEVCNVDIDDSSGLLGYDIGVRAAELLGIEVPTITYGVDWSEPEPCEIDLFDENTDLYSLRDKIAERFGER